MTAQLETGTPHCHFSCDCSIKYFHWSYACKLGQTKLRRRAMGQDSRLFPTRLRYYNLSLVVTLEKMGLRHIWDNRRHVDNRMEIVRHRTAVIR